MDELHMFIETCFAWPAFPATLLALGICLYWLFVILGALDFDGLDFDLDLDSDADSILGLGWVGLRSLNLGTVPLIIWLTVFGLSWWLFAMLVESTIAENDWSAILFVVIRDMGVAILLTKIITQPLRGKFDHKVPNPSYELVGKTCRITSSEVTKQFGQAEFKTEAAPLQLNVRASETGLTKGDVAEIVAFDKENHVYHVKKSDLENE